MKKIFKIIGLICLGLIGAAVLLIAIFWGSMEWGQHVKRQERIAYQREVCDTMKVVTGRFDFELSGFNNKKLKRVHFYIVRDQKIFKDSLVKIGDSLAGDRKIAVLPFAEFRTTDTIVLKAEDSYFSLSGLHYVAEQNYGMFGPVGPCDCFPTKFQLLNGKPWGSYNNWLMKKDGLPGFSGQIK